MTKKVSNNHKDNNKRGYIKEMISFSPKKDGSIVVRREIHHCSECGKENIVSFKLDAKDLKNVLDALDEKGKLKEGDMDKIFKALVSVPPPKSWKENRDEKREN